MAKESRSKKVKRSLRYSIFDGAFYSAMVGFGESYFSAFAVLLKATNFQIGLLESLPQGLSSISQLFTSRLLRMFRDRKTFILFNVMASALIYLPITFIFLFGGFQVEALIFFVCLYWTLGMVISPVWNSWMGDLVDPKRRGEYFGKRNNIVGIVTFSTYVFGGLILQLSSQGGKPYVGFALLFMSAMAARFISAFFLSLKFEPEYATAPKSEIHFKEFLKNPEYADFRTLVYYLTWMRFAVYLAAPFFTPYMLKELQLTYLSFTLVNAASIITKFASMPLWGVAADRFGSKKVLHLSSMLIPLVPLAWLFSSNIYYLIFIQLLSGFVWGAYEIAAFDYIYDMTEPLKRVKSVAYFNAFIGAALIAGSLLGGLLMQHVGFWSKFLFIFTISGVARLVATLYWMPKLKEPRKVPEISKRKLFLQVIKMVPTMGVVHSLVTFRRKR